MQFVTDEKGTRIGVLISIKRYEHFLDLEEELEDMKDYDERITSDDWLSLEEVERQLGV